MVPTAEERAEGRERILTAHGWTQTSAQYWDLSDSLPGAAFYALLEERTDRKIPFQEPKEDKAVAHLPQPLQESGVFSQPCSRHKKQTLDNHEPELANVR